MSCSLCSTPTLFQSFAPKLWSGFQRPPDHPHRDSSHLSTVHCDKKAIKLCERHTVYFSKIEAGSERWLWLKNETPGINRPTFLQLWPSQTHLERKKKKSMKNLPYAFHISQNKITATYLRKKKRFHKLNKGSILCGFNGNQLICYLHTCTGTHFSHTRKYTPVKQSCLALALSSALTMPGRTEICMGDRQSDWSPHSSARSNLNWKLPVIYSVA